MPVIDRMLAKLDHVIRGTRFEHLRGHAWILNSVPGGDDPSDRCRSTLRLIENGAPLLLAHQEHSDIIKLGAGRYLHWGNRLVFSTSDNSNPNTNQRSYSYDFELDRQTWVRARAAHAAQLWKFHPRADYFLQRGGTEIPPPMTCNIGLTNKCNLRCEICGSQKFLDTSGARRRHMARSTFEAVAETLFPSLVTVELNSQGDPLLHTDVADVLARIRQHGCEIKLQTNGTLFSDRIISMLQDQYGTVMLSLDAVGPKFDEVRQGGNWAKAAPGLRRFLSDRDPRRLSAGIYPTLTKRTIGEALNVVRWAVERGADLVAFHRYVPIANSWEQAPEDRDYALLRDHLSRWAADNSDPIEIRFEADVLNSRPMPERKTEIAHPEKQALAKAYSAATIPLETGMDCADPTYTCTAPVAYVEIGLEGQVEVCCRAQDVPLGYATSVEGFADTWFGTNYARIRKSLQRDQTGPYPLPNCESCIKFFAPVAGGNRSAINYDSEHRTDDMLSLGDADILQVEAIEKESGRCFMARIPPGVDPSAYAFYEDDRCLAAHQSLHDDIRVLGAGRYSINQRWLYFSTSDGTDARRNGRSYHLERQHLAEGEIALMTFAHDGGHGFRAGLPAEADARGVALIENNRALGPGDCLHDEIRSAGAGRFSVWRNSLYFATSDNSDPRANGRFYRLRKISLHDPAKG